MASTEELGANLTEGDTIEEFTGLIATCGTCGARHVFEKSTEEALVGARETLSFHGWMKHGGPKPEWLNR